MYQHVTLCGADVDGTEVAACYPALVVANDFRLLEIMERFIS